MSARNVIRFLKKANVSYYVNDPRTAGASEFFRQMSVDKTRKCNPKCEVKLKYTALGTEPKIDLQYFNGTKQTLEIADTDVKLIFELLQDTCDDIETEYEDQGKTIDNVL